MFKTLNYTTPEYLRDLFSDRNKQYSLRNSRDELNLQSPRMDCIKKKCSREITKFRIQSRNLRKVRSKKYRKTEKHFFMLKCKRQQKLFDGGK